MDVGTNQNGAAPLMPSISVLKGSAIRGIGEKFALFMYVGNRPIILLDESGHAGMPPELTEQEITDSGDQKPL